MNLKRKLNHKVTAIIRVIDQSTALISDECSDNDDCPIHLITVNESTDILAEALKLATVCNADTPFDHRILVYNQSDTECTPYIRKKQQHSEAVPF